LLDPIGREAGGRRRYDDADLARIAFLTKLRGTGMPIRQVREYAELLRAGEGNERERLAILEAHRDAVRARMAEMARHLELIDFKIDIYRKKL
jgi:DNA-binding transcriptional MerR regulator